MLDSDPDRVDDPRRASPAPGGLRFRVDDPDNPSFLTVHPVRGGDITTTWITVAVDDAVSLDRYR